MITTESCPNTRVQREKEFHNQVFSDHRREALEKYYSLGDLEYSSYRDFLVERTPGSRFLEYGCGPWGFVYEAAKTAKSTSAIDISEVAIEAAQVKSREQSLEIDFSVMNAEELVFPTDSFDLICGSSILHHLDLARSLAEIDRVLAPGGSAAFMEPLGHNWLINLYRFLTPSMRTPDEHPITRDDLRMIKEIFPGARYEFFHLSTLAAVPFRNSKHFNRIVGTANSFDQWLFGQSKLAASHAWFCNIYLER